MAIPLELSFLFCTFVLNIKDKIIMLKNVITLFGEIFNSDYNVNLDEKTDTSVTLCIGKVYDSYEYDKLSDKIKDAIAEFNILHIGKIFATEVCSSETNFYIGFFEYKDIPQSCFNFLKYAYENTKDVKGISYAKKMVYSKLLEIGLIN